MKKGWKIFWIILMIVILIGIIWGVTQYLKWKEIWDKIHFSKPIPKSLDLKGLNLSDLLNLSLGGTPKSVDATLEMFITNESETEIEFNNLKVELFYQGSILTETSDELYAKTYILPAKTSNSPGILTITDKVSIQLQQSAQFLREKILGGHPIVDYTVDLSVNGVPIGKIYPIKGNFTW